MKTNAFSDTKAMGSGCFLYVCMAIMALLIFVNPNSAQSTDRLIVTDTTGANNMFVAGDDGTVRLNSNSLSGVTWAYLYASSNGGNTGYVMDSYASPATGATTVTYGGGGAFRFARGAQSSPTAVLLGDRLGFFVFSGYDGAQFVNTSGFTSKVDGVVSSGNVPSKLVFETIKQSGEAADDGSRVERLVISSKGYVAIGGSGSLGTGIPSPSHVLQVTGPGGAVAYTDGTTWVTASSREYKENINTLTDEEANKVLGGLNPVKYNYKTDKENRHVGFIAEDVPDLVATKDRKGLSPMDIVAVLTRVVQEQKSTIAEQTNMISELAKRLDAMQQEINRVKGMNIVGSIGANIK